MNSKYLAGPQRQHTRFGEVAKYKEGLYQVAKDSYAWLVPNGSWGETNIGLLDCKGKTVLIDTFWDLQFTHEFLHHSHSILDNSPIEIVINTHADGDHCWGNQLFKDKEIIATQACVHQMHHINPLSLRSLQTGGKYLGSLPWLGLDAFGKYMSNMFKPYDFSDVVITDPNKSFVGEYCLNVNGVEILVIEVGPGHTDGDALVFVPDRKLVYSGDILFVGVTPVMWSGPLDNLVRGLEKLKALPVDSIVPGHGPLADNHSVQLALDYWHFLDEQLHRRWQQSMTPLEAAKDVVFSAEFQSLPFAQWDSPERIVTNAYTLYRHWGANLKTLPGKLGVMDIMRQQATLAMALPNAKPSCMHR